MVNVRFAGRGEDERSIASILSDVAGAPVPAA
jgi:hypothetical protein